MIPNRDRVMIVFLKLMADVSQMFQGSEMPRCWHTRCRSCGVIKKNHLFRVSFWAKCAELKTIPYILAIISQSISKRQQHTATTTPTLQSTTTSPDTPCNVNMADRLQWIQLHIRCTVTASSRFRCDGRQTILLPCNVNAMDSAKSL